MIPTAASIMMATEQAFRCLSEASTDYDVAALSGMPMNAPETED